MKFKSSPRNRSPRHVSATLCAFALAAMAGQSYAQVLQIGVNFLGRDDSQSGTNFQLGVNEFAGVFPQQDWNNLGNNVPGQPTGDFSNTGYTNRTSGLLFTDDSLADSYGTSGVTVTVSAADSWNSDGPSTTADQRLMSGIIKAKTNNPLTLTLSGLDAGSEYRFLAYSQENNSTGDVNFSLTGETAYNTYFVRQSSAFDGTFTEGTSTDSAARSTGVDYVQWNTVFADATGSLTLTVSYLGNGSDGGGLAGFQLMEILPPGADKFYNVGAGAGVFDNTTTNWRSANTAGTSDATFAARDNAYFGNLGTAGDRTVTVAAGGVEVGSLIVDNATGNNYTIGGDVIRGTKADFIKDGAGSLTLTGLNEFTGDATIKHGTVNVGSIGDALNAGNLGKGVAIILGDTTPGAAAVLNYTGATATANRAVAIGETGGTIAVGNGATLTLGNLTGTGEFIKGGQGGVTFVGTAGNFSGNFAIPQGNLTIGSMGKGTGTLTVGTAGAAAFSYGGGILNDGRAVVTGANATTLTVSNAGTRYQVASFTPGAGTVTIGGPGRLAVAGVANFGGGLPVIAPGGTLALQNESTTTPNIVPAGNISVAANTTLEIAPGALGANTNGTLVLNGGTVRLAHEGLQGQYYNGGANGADLSGSAQSVANYFSALGNPALVARTNTNGRANLGFGDAAAGAPFADQGFTPIDQVRGYFTGKILITESGATKFFTTSDDGSVVFINGQ
ncbi:MAG: hypothetical protein EOP84_12620, partial [Verrucomicrobiaceae bacterium]